MDKFEKFENWTDVETRCQNEEKLCKSIIKGIAGRNREKRVILAEIEEEEQDVVCMDEMSLAKNCRGMQCSKLVNKT